MMSVTVTWRIHIIVSFTVNTFVIVSTMHLHSTLFFPQVCLVFCVVSTEPEEDAHFRSCGTSSSCVRHAVLGRTFPSLSSVSDPRQQSLASSYPTSRQHPLAPASDRWCVAMTYSTDKGRVAMVGPTRQVACCYGILY